MNNYFYLFCAEKMSRELGNNILHTICSDNTQIESMIHKLTSSPDEYVELLYQVVNDILVNKTDSAKIMSNLEDRKILRNHPDFYQLSLDENEQNNFIIKPFEVEEGISTCKKCGSKRVFSYQKQSRSSDEPSTTYCECVACRSRWTYSG